MSTELKKTKIVAEIAIHGNASRACKRAGVPRRTFYLWFKNEEYFRGLVQDAVKRSRG